MSTEAVREFDPLSPFEQLRYGRQIIQSEGQALLALAQNLPHETFSEAANLIYGCQGSVIVTGMGKAGLIGQKLVATLASTGTRSHFLHPAEAIHGDLGRIHATDCVLALSFRGETEELLRILPSINDFGVPLVAITGRAQSTLARYATVTLDLGTVPEADALGLAPSTSTTLMLALGDALALVVSRMRGFRATDFARFHPGGSLGRQLARVDDVMRPLEECRVAEDSRSVRDVFTTLSRPGRRSGAIMLVDADGALTGIFTDSDLARLFEGRREAAVDGPIRDVMTANPMRTTSGVMLMAAVDLLAQRKISELPVVNEKGQPVGLIDITDVLSLLPAESREGAPAESTQSRGSLVAKNGRFPFRTVS